MKSTLPLPTRRLALLVAAVGAIALVVPISPVAVLLVGNLAVFVVALTDWQLAQKPALFEIVRELPTAISLDETGKVLWQITNPTNRAVTLGICDELAPSLRPVDRRAVFQVPPRATFQTGTTIRPTRRGRFEPTKVTLRVAGPLGLVARQADRLIPGLLRVIPRYRSRAQAELRINLVRRSQLGLRITQGFGGGTEFDSLREYTVDDPIKRIDWAATARAGRAIVKTYRAERNQQVICLLDCGRTMAARIENEPRIEHAMDAVMMITHVATRLGDRAGLVAFDAQVRAVVSPGSEISRLQDVTEAMYTIEPRLVESDYRGAFVETLGRFRRRSMLVLFSELAEQAIADTLLPALPMVVRDHVVIVASVVDPDVSRWARGVPLDSRGVYQKAAAVAALEERRRVTLRLQRLGVTVVDAAPGTLGPRLVDAYLKVKAVGRL